MNASQTIVGGVLVFFALLAVITIVRVVLRREANAWTRLRVGFFVERDREDDDERPHAPPSS